MSTHTHWNLRVYLLLMHPSQPMLLVSKETIGERVYYKLPGGGVEFGEGIADAAAREAHEELGIDIQLDQPYYFTEYYLPSLFKREDQVVAFYYLASSAQLADIAHHTTFEAKDTAGHTFEWIPLAAFPFHQFTLASDRIVLERLIRSQA